MEHNNEFDDMMSGWKQQPIPEPTISDFEAKAKQKAKFTNNKHIATIVVLSITLLVILGFSIYVGFSNLLFSVGISLMMLMLAIRIGVELWSQRLLLQLDSTMGTSNYVNALARFYQIRKRIHGTFTYLVFGVYVAGFCILVPLFKQTVSFGFFVYIIVSGIATFTILIVYIRKKTKDELKELQGTINELKSIVSYLDN